MTVKESAHRDGLEIAAANLLSRNQLFSAMDPAQIEQTVSAATTVTLPKGKILFTKGDAANAVYLLVDGEVAIEVISSEGSAVRITTLSRGAVFGELGVLDDGKRTADARATKQSTILSIGKQYFQNLIQSTPDFSKAIIHDLVKKLRDTNYQIEDISFKPLKLRLAAMLLTLANNSDEQAPILYITQSDLADRLSATREKVNIHLQDIQRSSAIKIDRGRINILDKEILSDFINQ